MKIGKAGQDGNMRSRLGRFLVHDAGIRLTSRMDLARTPLCLLGPQIGRWTSRAWQCMTIVLLHHGVRADRELCAPTPVNVIPRHRARELPLDLGSNDIESSLAWKRAGSALFQPVIDFVVWVEGQEITPKCDVLQRHMGPEA
jgi:hypothetical protein